MCSGPSRIRTCVGCLVLNPNLLTVQAYPHRLACPVTGCRLKTARVPGLSAGKTRYGSPLTCEQLNALCLVAAPTRHTSKNNRAGSSIPSLIVTRNWTASRPSTIRWSYVNAMYIIGRTTT